MAMKDIPSADAIQVRALRGRGVAVIVSLQGHALARLFFTFAQARQVGADLSALVDDYGTPHTDHSRPH
jgi:hypothetical protein